MTAFLEKLAEEKILKGLREGAFQNLPGEGKPLPEEDIRIPDDLRMAYRMLKTSNFLPPELELRKEISHTGELLAAAEDVQEKLKIMGKLNIMIRKLNILKPVRLDCEIREHYLPRLVERMETAPLCSTPDFPHEKKD